MLINSGDEGGCRKTIPFFYVQTFLVQIPSGILFGKIRITMPNNIRKETTGMIY
jgi:hypothetical protein